MDEGDVRKILGPMLAEICQNLHKQYQIALHVEEEAELFIAHAGYNSQYGVRELRRTVEKLVQIPLSELILANKMEQGSRWQITQKDQELRFSIV